MPYPPSQDRPPRYYPQFASYEYGCTGLNLYTEASWAAGWIEYLLDPPLVGETEYDEPQPKIQDMAFADFFYPSDVVSGQDRDAMERLYDVLEAARFKNADGVVSTHVCNNLYNAIDFFIGGTAQGISATNLELYREQLHNFYPDHLKSIAKLSQCLVGYSAAVGRARDDLALVMRQFVQKMEAFQRDAADEQRKRLTLFAEIGQWVIDVFPFKEEESAVFASLLGKALEKAAPQDEKGGHDPAAIDGSTYNDIAASFLREVNRITNDARAAIEDVTRKVRQIPDGLTAPPAVNAG